MLFPLLQASRWVAGKKRGAISGPSANPGSQEGGADMTVLRMFTLALAITALTVAPALAHGGGGGAGGGGGGGGGAGAGGGGGHGNGGVATGDNAGPGGGMAVGAGRGTALSAPGSQHRSNTATEHLSTPTPGRANPRSGVTPGRGR